MKPIIYRWIAVLCLGAIALYGCKDDSNERVFKQYLLSRINEAEILMNSVVFGAEEGEYKEGALDIVSSRIEEAHKIYWDASISQQSVDACYNGLSEAMIRFGDYMHPYKSVMQDMINLCRDLITNISIGEGEGMIPSASDKEDLLTAVKVAEKFMSDNPETTQRLLDEAYTKLQSTLFLFEGKIPGKQNVSIENQSFEQPGVSDIYSNFNEIPGWNSEGWIAGLTPWNDLLSSSIVKNTNWWFTLDDYRILPNGNYALHTSNYCGRVWQALKEGVHVNSRYTLSFDIARMTKWASSDMRLLVQMIIFKGKAGDFSNISILKEMEVSGVENIENFTTQKMTLDVGSQSEYAGKHIVLCMRGYVTKAWQSTADKGFVWSEHGVEVDNIVLTREKHISIH